MIALRASFLLLCLLCRTVTSGSSVKFLKLSLDSVVSLRFLPRVNAFIPRRLLLCKKFLLIREFEHTGAIGDNYETYHGPIMTSNLSPDVVTLSHYNDRLLSSYPVPALFQSRSLPKSSFLYVYDLDILLFS